MIMLSLLPHFRILNLKIDGNSSFALWHGENPFLRSIPELRIPAVRPVSKRLPELWYGRSIDARSSKPEYETRKRTLELLNLARG